MLGDVGHLSSRNVSAKRGGFHPHAPRLRP
jgi:hypothetical protein